MDKGKVKAKKMLRVAALLLALSLAAFWISGQRDSRAATAAGLALFTLAVAAFLAHVLRRQ